MCCSHAMLDKSVLFISHVACTCALRTLVPAFIALNTAASESHSILFSSKTSARNPMYAPKDWRIATIFKDTGDRCTIDFFWFNLCHFCLINIFFLILHHIVALLLWNNRKIGYFDDIQWFLLFFGLIHQSVTISKKMTKVCMFASQNHEQSSHNHEFRI